jgi:hypothetical protein
MYLDCLYLIELFFLVESPLAPAQRHKYLRFVPPQQPETLRQLTCRVRVNDALCSFSLFGDTPQVSLILVITGLFFSKIEGLKLIALHAGHVSWQIQHSLLSKI